MIIKAVKIFRVLRVLRLIKRAKSLRFAFSTLIECVPDLINIGSFLSILLGIYSLLGTYLFAEVKRNGVFSDVINFESFINSALTLFISATADIFTPAYIAATKQFSVDFQCITNPTFQDYVNNECKSFIVIITN
jgi:hypothetical protein